MIHSGKARLMKCQWGYALDLRIKIKTTPIRFSQWPMKGKSWEMHGMGDNLTLSLHFEDDKPNQNNGAHDRRTGSDENKK